jgi:hypothetical protein
MPNEWDKIWENQAQFNRQIRPDPTTFESKSLLTAELVLAATDELHELLRTTKWKKHRRPRRYEVNLAHTTEELVDTFIDLISLCQTWNVSPEMLMDGYWAKMAVNRQRYSEEWVKNHIDGPVILLDLDNVLCDYITGFGNFILDRVCQSRVLAEKYYTMFKARVERREWLDSSLVPDDKKWFEDVKHTFRTGGYKRHIPAMPGATEFVRWCRTLGSVILLTARPIDAYPNMLTDTMFWLQANSIAVDHIWWGVDKGKVVEIEGIQKHVRFAVDDVRGHCHQYQDHGIRSYWLSPFADKHEELITAVSSFDDIKCIEEGRDGIR